MPAPATTIPTRRVMAMPWRILRHLRLARSLGSRSSSNWVRSSVPFTTWCPW
ncbi:hypothetical protein [Sinomonas atrocyanea]